MFMTHEKSFKDRASAVKILILDCDGVLTDARAGYLDAGGEFKEFSIHDGAGLKYLLRAGLKAAVITGRKSAALKTRMQELGITDVTEGALVKLDAYEKLKKRLVFHDEEVAYLGDDLPDLPVMKKAGLAAATANAVSEVKRHAHYVTKNPGGSGAAREVVEMILKIQGRWPGIMKRYLPDFPEMTHG